MTNQGLRRNPAGLRQVAERTGVRIIMGSGYYKAQWHPADMDTKSVESIAAEIVADLTVGVDGTGIRAGVIGEVGVSTLTPNEAKALRASARAQRQTGAAINLHFDIGVPEALRQRGLDLLEADGADLNRVATSHFRLIPEERELQLRMAARGSYIEFDLFGQERLFTAEVPGYEKESRALRVLIDRGCLERILFSSDICYRQTLVRCGGWGYAHLLANVLPRLRRHGITEAETHAVTVANPARLLAVQWP
jgi:phosphotriesterase-related protein